jgi:MFS family permease
VTVDVVADPRSAHAHGLLRNRRFTALWCAVGAANLADGAFQVALPTVLVAGDEPIWSIPLVLGASRLPWVLLTLSAGVLADRFDRRTLMIGSYLTRGASVLVVALGAALHAPLVVVAVIAAFCIGAAETLGDTTAHTVTPAVVGRERLVRANGLLQSTELTANLLVGPACAGLLALASPTAALIASAVAYGLAAIAAATLPGVRANQATRLVRLSAGLVYLLHARRLLLFAVSIGLLNLGYAMFQSGLPLKVFGAGDGELVLGLYWAASGLVCLGLGGITSWLIDRFGNLAVLLAGVAGMGAGYLVVGLQDDRWLMGWGSALTGSLVLVNVVTVSYRQSVVPDVLLGRVTAAYRLLAFGGFPVGSLLAGLLVTRSGVDLVLLSALFPVGAAAMLFVIAHLIGDSRL